jgi:hypothetical protein
MPRAGTGWLYDQLANHPQFWIPPIKEIRYLAHERSELAAHARRRLERWDRRAVSARRGRQNWDEREKGFLMDAASLGNEKQDLSKYAWLFRHKGDLLSGDISPGYMQLNDEGVRCIADHFPHVRILFFIRDPVSRAWSRICLAHRNGDFDVSVLDGGERFRAFIKNAKMLRDRSYPTQVTARWQRCAPEIAFRYYFFEEIRDTPDAVRRDMLLFLGADPAQDSGPLASDHNRKANSAMLFMEEATKAILIEHFREEILACAETYGGRATEWASKYGLT